MKLNLSRAWIVIPIFCVAPPLAAQVSSNPGGVMGTGNRFHGRSPQLPYTAEFKVTQVRTLANGTTITTESTEVRAVDSHGRQMTSNTRTQPSSDQAQSTFVHVFDPEARTNTSWNSPGKRATVTTMPAPGSSTSCANDSQAISQEHPPVQREKPTTEDLGTDVIQGVEGRGRRTTITTPAGAIGNSEPLITTTEMWTATDPGLVGLVVRLVHDNPQSGKRTTELVNLTQSEPDPALFQPPEGYEVVTHEPHACTQ